MIELYHCPDGRSLRCLWLLEEIGVAYRLHLLPFPPRLLAPSYLEINPLGTIPFLIDGAARMTESAAILEYLSVRYGAPPLTVLPAEDDYGDWLDWIHFGEASLTTPQTVVLRYGLFAEEEARLPAVQEEFRQVFLDKLAVVETRLRDHAYLCADRFTAADICVGYALSLASYIGAAERMPQSVRDYLTRLQARPAFQAALAAQKT